MDELETAVAAEQEQKTTDTPPQEAGFLMPESDDGKPDKSSAQEDTRDYDAEARDMGWVPEGEWRGDKKPAKFLSAQEFVERGETVIPILKRQLEREKEEREREKTEFQKRLERMERMSQESIKRAKAQYETELKRIKSDQKKAVEAADTDEWERLESEREALIKSAPEEIEEAKPPADDNAKVESEWVGKNPWYSENFEMAREANEYSQFVARRNPNMPLSENLKMVDEHIRKKFPEQFGLKKPAARNGHAAVDGGGDFPGATKPAGLSSRLKPEEMAIAKKNIAEGLYKNVDEWAAVYFSK